MVKTVFTKQKFEVKFEWIQMNKEFVIFSMYDFEESE